MSGDVAPGHLEATIQAGRLAVRVQTSVLVVGEVLGSPAVARQRLDRPFELVVAC